MNSPRTCRWLLIVLLLATGCGPAAPATPVAVVREFCRLANAGQARDAARFLEPALAQALLLAPGAPESPVTLLDAEARRWTRDGAITEVRVLGQRHEGPAAIVDVRLHFRDGTELTGAFALWQTGTDWRIASNGFAQ
jgi:hypothetical protein